MHRWYHVLPMNFVFLNKSGRGLFLVAFVAPNTCPHLYVEAYLRPLHFKYTVVSSASACLPPSVCVRF